MGDQAVKSRMPSKERDSFFYVDFVSTENLKF
jgi:hypothetical protein